ncbi:hypothetical protein CGGC5_v017266 [Colletotrichum fructicola Nara gc5]|uniref:Uncharacterized protein n=1 Tax=Colletotrichum fructicola (strain Nara gc5) TaxID=1213859 RepID=A0A7J6ICA9_COLFN|nr:hypothetical protein CGGC5_v017266 [Colletotrichum fructicola Nara gc5]
MPTSTDPTAPHQTYELQRDASVVEEDDCYEAGPNEVTDNEGRDFEDEVDMPSTRSGPQRWAVTHSTGHHRLHATRFIYKVLSDTFEPADALNMLQVKHTIDFGARSAGATQAKAADTFIPQFFLDFFSIVGKPGRPITRRSAPLLDNVIVSFERYGAPYSTKHVGGVLFNMTGRTFRIAQAGTREVWFIVMHPLAGSSTQSTTSAGYSQQEPQQQSSSKSAMPIGLARELASYITSIFQSSQLLGEGVDTCWRPGGKDSQRISSAQWYIFQTQFMNGWAAWVSSKQDADSYWRRHEPAFHAYDYGANLEIKVGEEIFNLPRETHAFRESDGEADVSQAEEDGDVVAENNVQASLNSFILNNSDSESSAGPARQEEDSHPHNANNQTYQQILRESDKLHELVTELSSRFSLDDTAAISYALAVCIHSQSDGGQTRCLLADRNMVARMFPGSRNYTFYPQAFHPRYGNFSGSRPPAFLDPLCTAMRGNMSDYNDGADVLSFGYFQGYSNIKRSVRHSPNALLATKGYATAALTAPTSHTSTSSHTRDKREAMLQRIRGQLTPGSPEQSKPFARERRKLNTAIDQEEFAYRMEQVVSLNIHHMCRAERTFAAVIRPIFQLIRFFCAEHESYIRLFRSIPPQVFPRTKLFIASQLRRRLQEAAEPASTPITSAQIAACKSAITAWEATPEAFTSKALQELTQALTPGGSRLMMAESKTRTRRDYAAELVRAITTGKGRAAVAPVHSTWPDRLQVAIASGGLSNDEWVTMLDKPTGRLTSTTIVCLHGRCMRTVVTGPPGSLRRAAQEAQIRHENALHNQALRRKRRAIHFGDSFPFTNVPSLITDGFLKAKATFSNKGDLRVLDHYQLAINILSSNIDDPLCCLMLMITLTVCSSSETPEVAPGSREFGTAAKRKDPAQLALVMVTRMMWFLYPASFPWKKGSSGTAYDVAEMTKKIEHKGCSNRMLRELGWVTSKSNRDSPRNTDLQLRPQEDLLQTFRELRSAMKRPDDFIGVVFNSQDSIWTERCASIIKDR